MGVTVTVASGDNGSADGLTTAARTSTSRPPARSPWPAAGPGSTGPGTTITEEIVWNDGADSATGGGVSDFFALPSYQTSAHVPKSLNRGHFAGRGVPDVAGDADPNVGLRGPGRRPDTGHRRHQRRRAALGRPDRPAQPEAGQAGRVPQPAALFPGRRGGRAPHDHLGQQRRLQGAGRAGTPAPGWARPTARRSSRCWAARPARGSTRPPALPPLPPPPPPPPGGGHPGRDKAYRPAAGEGETGPSSRGDRKDDDLSPPGGCVPPVGKRALLVADAPRAALTREIQRPSPGQSFDGRPDLEFDRRASSAEPDMPVGAVFWISAATSRLRSRTGFLGSR